MKFTKKQLANIKRWVDALRSGAYKQCRALLRGGFDGSQYCCLGVALDLLDPTAWLEDRVGELRQYAWQDPNFPTLTYQYGWGVRRYGSIQSTAYKNFGLTEDHVKSLMRLNDSEVYNFNEIADYIEHEICKDYDLNTLGEK